MKNTKIEKVTVKYNASVLVDAGWRSVEATAVCTKVSEKMATVEEVTLIDGKEPVGYTSRTGAKRQTYNASSIAKREVGKKKRLSACEIVE